MMNTNMTSILLMMIMIMIITMMTTKTSIMCLNLAIYTLLMSMVMSMKMKLTPIPFIIFLTIIGGLMILFLYLATTIWMKKETMTLKLKILMISTLLIPLYSMNQLNQMKPKNMPMIFENNFNKMSILLIIMLTIVLMYVIEIHMKMNLPFRRKLKIWE